MSPEQAAADPNIDHRADIYAWGVIAYELLAGRHPFEGKKTPQQYLGAHLAEVPAPLATAARSVPRAAVDLTMRALEKDPDKRPQTGDDLLSGLGGVSSTSEHAASNNLSDKLAWRKPAIGIAAILALALGFAALKGTRNASAKEPIMLAVLPFENQGPAEQDYFVDGLTDAVNGKLAGLSGISVIDRRSTSAYKKTTKPVKQIGTELGVAYVLGGVVRWARIDTTWRAQVMPTLVNTKDATTKWAGEPVVVSSSDPFTAQTEIATKVASALRVALVDSERRELAERPTENTAAYDAYLRGKAIYEANWRTSASIKSIDQAISEFRRAVALDPRFAQGWALLAQASYERSVEVPGDTVSLRTAMSAAKTAEQFDSDDPLIINVKSALAWMAGDRQGATRIIEDAVKKGIAGPELLTSYAFDLSDRGMTEAAKDAMANALKLNPRYAPTLLAAAGLSEDFKDWIGAERYARTLLSIDPTDERAWAQIASVGRSRGDTAMIQRAIEDAFKYIPAPSNLLLVFMVYAGDELGSRFVRMTPEQIRIESLRDSISTYYDNKLDYFLGRGDLPRARVYADSIIRKLEGRHLAGPGESYVRLFLANAYVVAGRSREAATELAKAKEAAKANAEVNLDGSLDLDHRMIAAVLGGVGRYDEAVRELRRVVATTAWTRAGLAREPKLKRFRGNPQFEEFLRERAK